MAIARVPDRSAPHATLRATVRTPAEVDGCFTREELLAARSAPPVTVADVPLVHHRIYKGAKSRPYKEKPRRFTVHGTLGGYARGCRCVPCADARRAYDRAARARRAAS